MTRLPVEGRVVLLELTVPRAVGRVKEADLDALSLSFPPAVVVAPEGLRLTPDAGFLAAAEVCRGRAELGRLGFGGVLAVASPLLSPLFVVCTGKPEFSD